VLDQAGFTARVIADQLGHSKPSMTQDVYMGRNAPIDTTGGLEALG
jgi:integrase